MNFIKRLFGGKKISPKLLSNSIYRTDSKIDLHIDKLKASKPEHEKRLAINDICDYGPNSVWAFPLLISNVTPQMVTAFEIEKIQYGKNNLELIDLFKQCGPSGATVAIICLVQRMIKENSIVSKAAYISLIDQLIDFGADGSFVKAPIEEEIDSLKKLDASDFFTYLKKIRSDAKSSLKGVSRENKELLTEWLKGVSDEAFLISLAGGGWMEDKFRTMDLLKLEDITDDTLEKTSKTFNTINKRQVERLEDFMLKINDKASIENNDVESFIERTFKGDSSIAIRTKDLETMLKRIEKDLILNEPALPIDESKIKLSTAIRIQCPICGELDINKRSICQCGMLILRLDLSPSLSCEKCGSTELEYDKYFDQFNCNNCGWIKSL